LILVARVVVTDAVEMAPERSAPMCPTRAPGASARRSQKMSAKLKYYPAGLPSASRSAPVRAASAEEWSRPSRRRASTRMLAGYILLGDKTGLQLSNRRRRLSKSERWQLDACVNVRRAMGLAEERRPVAERFSAPSLGYGPGYAVPVPRVCLRPRGQALSASSTCPVRVSRGFRTASGLLFRVPLGLVERGSAS